VTGSCWDWNAGIPTGLRVEAASTLAVGFKFKFPVLQQLIESTVGGWDLLETVAVGIKDSTTRQQYDLSAVSVDVLDIASEIGCASVATGTGLVLVTVGINDSTTVAIGNVESPVDNIFNDSMTLTALTITNSSAWQQLESTVWW